MNRNLATNGTILKCSGCLVSQLYIMIFEGRINLPRLPWLIHKYFPDVFIKRFYIFVKSFLLHLQREYE